MSRNRDQLGEPLPQESASPRSPSRSEIALNKSPLRGMPAPFAHRSLAATAHDFLFRRQGRCPSSKHSPCSEPGMPRFIREAGSLLTLISCGCATSLQGGAQSSVQAGGPISQEATFAAGAGLGDGPGAL